LKLVTTLGKWLRLSAALEEGRDRMQDFLNPKSMLTPGVTRTFMMFLVNGLLGQFPELSPRFTALGISFHVRGCCARGECLCQGAKAGGRTLGNQDLDCKVIAGALFFDDAHVGDAPRGKKGMHAATLREVHPVIGVRFVKP
jgi:hypothetical protein